ncbi:MAG: hypothetical protein ACOCZ6_04055 [Nanoarchaeota archaeon]
MKIFKCRICKNPYLGKESPSNCAYCGVFSKYLKETGRINEEHPYLDNETGNYMLRIYEDKLKNRIFYKEAKKHMINGSLKSLLEIFQRVEETHIKIFEGMGFNKSLPEKRPHVYKFEEDNLTEIFTRKKNSIEFQKKILKRIYDPYLVELLDALSGAEESHLEILEKYM